MFKNLTLSYNIIKFKETFTVIFTGILLGIFILTFGGLTARWIVSFSIVLLIIFIGMIVKNPKRFFLTIFFLSLPIITSNFIGKLSRIHYGGPPGFYNTFYDFPLLILYILWIPKLFLSKTAKINFTKLDLCFVGLIGISFLSMYNAVDIKLCLYEIFRLVIMFAIFFYIANNITEKRNVKYIIICLLIGLFSESLLGIFQYLIGETFGLTLIGGAREMMTFQAPRQAISRVAGTLGHPNNFSTYLGFFLPLTVSLFFAPIKKLYKIICGLIFLVGVSALILTLSRGGWIAFMISMVVLFILCLKAKLFSLHWDLSKVVVSIILLTIIIFALQGFITTRLISDDYGAAYSRIPQMKVAINIIKTHPFLGIGINNYTLSMQHYDNTPERISSIFPSTVHNSYLLIAAELGIVGLLLFLWFVLLVYKKGIYIIKKNRDRFITCFTIGILAGISAFLIHIIIEPVYMVKPIFIFFWTMCGVITALNYRESSNG